MRKPRLTLLSVAIAATLALSACGDDGEPFDATSLTGTPVSMTEMEFAPDQLTVNAGEEVEIALVNDGSVKHNLSIDEVDVDKDLSANDGESVTFTAPDSPGEYKIYCAIPGHESAGMTATLIVEE
jgi:plastocyanin